MSLCRYLQFTSGWCQLTTGRLAFASLTVMGLTSYTLWQTNLFGKRLQLHCIRWGSMYRAGAPALWQRSFSNANQGLRWHKLIKCQYRFWNKLTGHILAYTRVFGFAAEFLTGVGRVPENCCTHTWARILSWQGQLMHRLETYYYTHVW